MKTIGKYVLIIGLLLAVSAPCLAIDINQSAGARLWYAQLNEKFSGVKDNRGWDPMYLLYYDLGAPPWIVSAMGGYGEGWDKGRDGDKATRMDGQITAGRQFGPILIGAAFHYLHFEFKNIPNTTANFRQTYYGPELVVSGGVPLGDTGWSLNATGIWSPYMFAEAGYSNGGEKDSDNTKGLGFDLGLSYLQGNFRSSAGYRFYKLNEWSAPKAGATSEEFGGPYLELGVVW